MGATLMESLVYYSCLLICLTFSLVKFNYQLITLSDTTIKKMYRKSDFINIYGLLIFTAIFTVVKKHVYF